MIIGLSVGAFTTLHVIISLIGLASGILALADMLGGKRPGPWTAVFLCSTILTSATGFLFHSAKIGPPHIIGALSLAVLLVAVVALYGMKLKGVWRPLYIVSAIMALWFNAFVGVVQAFQKISFLTPLAPTGSEPPFAIAQLVVLLAFVGVGWLAIKRFHPVLAPSA